VNPEFVCPECQSQRVSTEMRFEDFSFRAGGIDYPVHSAYPAHVCADCGASFIGESGEIARHEAVCTAMNRLTPREILTLRQDKLRLSREALSELSGIGEASFARWETGELIQSESNDNLLRLLMIPENVSALRKARHLQAIAEPAPAYVEYDLITSRVVDVTVTSRGAHLHGLRAANPSELAQGREKFRLKTG
jgi:putative zinc finger/helix-turn-helix YgiT family protein